MAFPLAFLLALAAPTAAANGLAWKAGFGLERPWNDGNAEVSTYDSRDVRYGIPRKSRAVLIVVAEDLLGAALVKADNPARAMKTRRALKLNYVRSIQTGVYRYEQMLSAFLGANLLDPLKLTVSSHEWCGNSFVEWRVDRPTLAIRTYFETPGDADVPLSPGDAVFYDVLPLKLRGLDFEQTREGRLRIIESVFASHPSPPHTEEARLTVARLSTPHTLYRVTVERGTMRDTLDFETAFPHGLLRWDRSDGGLLQRTDARRFRYWEKNAPGDERFLSPPATR